MVMEVVTTSDRGRSANEATLSVTRTVKAKVPGAAGRPLIEPLTERASPLGSVPEEMDHVYGGLPPEAPNCWL